MTEVESGTAGSVPSAERLVREEADQSSLPSVYCNGFEFAASLSDVSVDIQLSGKPQQRLHMSFTTAKALMIGMQELIAHIERASGQEIPTMQQMNAGLTAAARAAPTPTAKE
ncbi:MAG: hypothetical protein OXC19_12105 [Bryobacterales bacterium]|nr:hypothetical protein [Bryobacterales bacterium]